MGHAIRGYHVQTSLLAIGVVYALGSAHAFANPVAKSPAALADPHSQPGMGKHAPAGTKWGSLQGPLFGDHAPWVWASDVIQGDVGDCTLMAPIADLARIRPEVIKEHIIDKGNGSVVITLYDGQSLQPVQVVVDKQVPMLNGKPIYAKASKDGKIWAALVEKAVAKLRGDYDLTQGHTTGQMATLTGWQCTGMPAPLAPSVALSLMRSHLKERHIVLTSTLDPTNFALLPPAIQKGLKPGHEVSILATKASSPQAATILIRNPWGNATQVGDGFVWYSLEDYSRIFEGMNICGPDL